MSTAQAGANVPVKFFLPKALMPFLTPTPESFCESVVVGMRSSRMPRCAVAAAKPPTSSSAPPPMTARYEWRSRPVSLTGAADRLGVRRVVFDTRSPPGSTQGRAGQREGVGMALEIGS